MGTGTCATVYAEWDPLLGRSVAVKELNPACARSEAFARAFLAQAERLFDLDHEHVLAMYRVDAGREAPAVVRELAEATLEAAILAGPLSPTEVEAILRCALLGLQAMHERGVVHGAVKPQNLFRSGGRVKIGDFGVSTLSMLPKTSPVPARRYMAPELLCGEAASPASDLYSLGIVAYELLLGRARCEEIARASTLELPPLEGLLSGAPPALLSAVYNLVRNATADRAVSADVVLASLGTMEASNSTGAGVSAPSVLDTSALDARLRPPKPKPVVDVQKLKRAGAIAIALLLAGFTIAAILFLRNQRPAEPPATHKAAPPAKLATFSQAAAPQATEPTLTVTSVAAPAPTPVPSSPPVSPSTVPATPLSAAPNAAKLKKTLPSSPGQSAAKAPAQESAPTAEEIPPRESDSRESVRVTQTLDARELIQNLKPVRYELGSLRNGQRAYVDQSATYAEVPTDQGRFCIETADGDRKGGTLSFQLSREAKVFVAHDHSIGKKPGWLKSFTATGETWSVLDRNAGGESTGLIQFDVFERTYPAGTVNLGPNIERSLFSNLLGKGRMYLVCVEAQ